MQSGSKNYVQDVGFKIFNLIFGISNNSQVLKVKMVYNEKFASTLSNLFSHLPLPFQHTLPILYAITNKSKYVFFSPL